MRTFPSQQFSFSRSSLQHCSRQFQITRQHKRKLIAIVFLAAALLIAIVVASGQQFTFIPNGTFFANPTGPSETYSAVGGGIGLTGPFSQSLGTNGRSCGSCHQPSDAMSVSATNVQQRFVATQGLDPIFRTNDGSNCNHSIDVSTLVGRSAAYSLLRTRGLIRVVIRVLTNADFQVVNVNNPYGCNVRNTV